MKKFLTLSFVLSLLVVVSLSAQTEVRTYAPGVTSDGITYFLPRTALHITITATRKVNVPGEYASYAERLLRIKGVPQESTESWVLTAIDVTPFGVADKSQAYTIKLKPKTAAPLVNLAEDGRLLGVNAEDVPGEPVLSAPSLSVEDEGVINGADYKTAEILAAGSRVKMAELTAAEIYDIRENRSLLTKGQADFMPKDGEQLNLMLAELDRQEEGLLSLFKGTTRTETHVFTMVYMPEKEVKKELLFRFSKHLGLVEKDDLAGEPYYVSITDRQTLPVAETPQGAKPKKEVLDLRYMVPARATVSIADETRTLYAASIAMAQFGRIEHLGGDLFNKKFTTSVILSPQTGGIQRIDVVQPQ